MRYCTDYQVNINNQYYNLFSDDGWELVWKGAGGWYIWKKSYDAERPEIYSDSKSLIARNNRLMKILGSIACALVPIFILLLSEHNNTLFNYLIGLYIVLFIFYGYLLLKLKRCNKKLSQNSIKG